MAGPAILASPLASGATTMDVPKPTSLKTDGDITKTEKKKEKGDEDVDKSSKRTKMKQENIAKNQKREGEYEREMEEKTARQQGMTDVSSPGASSSGVPAPPGVCTPASVGEKRKTR